MNKSKIIMAVTIGIMSFIMIYVMLIQFRTVNENDTEEIELMRETQLRETLASYKEKYEEVREELENVNLKIEEYKKNEKTEEDAVILLEEEVKKVNMLLGKTKVHGQGIVITIENNDESMVSYLDLVGFINELRLAGAEAISINDERIVSTSDIFNVGNFILINGQRTTSPYVIKAIGDTKYLQSALSIKGGYIDMYTLGGYVIKIEEKEDIIINKYQGEMTLKYVKK